MTISFPTDKTQPFQADNGIIYVWDDNRWRVKAFRSVDDFIVIIDDNPPDPAQIGDLWYDTKPDELTLYLYTGTEWVPAAPPVSLDGINATIDAALLVQNDLLDEQQVQNSQINALETQIQLLAQTQAVGKWTYRRNITNTLRPPATATFYGTDVDAPTVNVLTDWSKLQLIMVDSTDIDGTTYTFADFQEGDKLEIIATDGSSACFGTVTNDPNVDGYGNLVIAVERSNGGPVEEATYLLSVYRPGANTGDTDLDALDGRYVIKTGDEMSNNAYLDFPGGGLHFKHTDGVKKSYFYNAAEGISQWTAYNGTQLKVTARDGDPGGGRTYIDIKTADSSGTAGEDTGYRMKLFHVADPTDDLHAANKRYVDQNSQPPTPARFKWEWVGKAEDHAGNTLTTGQFSGPQLGQGNTTYGLLYYLNLTALNASYRINSRPNDEEMQFPDANGGPLLSVWSDPVTDNSSTITLMCVQRIKRLKFVGTNYQTDGGFIEIETHQGAGYSHHFAGTGLSFNRHYYIQLSGVF